MLHLQLEDFLVNVMVACQEDLADGVLVSFVNGDGYLLVSRVVRIW